MAKKRKCRLTEDEVAIHDMAVRLRKMTDRQLVEAFQNASQERTEDEPTNYTTDTTDLEKLLRGLARGECKGVKSGTVYKISEYARQKGLIV